ncbi:hypothetical protein [Acidisoma cladoniae]|uniref:hypothetical protein n=1 Tax=Acidisoma cladoniae TaxID=3040935 RepID=UPI00254B35F5|nr:hypothetical protein [Acidisoma sp. PAMC 29798]
METPIEQMTPDGWAETARLEVKAAKLMAGARLWGQAYQHAGFSIELALKCRIMRTQRLNRWPSPGERRDLYVHDLAVLARAAQIEGLLQEEIARGTALGMAWLVAKDWDNNARYSPRQFPIRVARDMVDAAVKSELIKWLIKP